MGCKESNQTNKAAHACIKKALPVLVDPVHKVWDFSHVHAAEPRLTLHFLHTHAYKNTSSVRNNIYACALNTTISWTDRTLHVYLIWELIFDHQKQTPFFKLAALCIIRDVYLQGLASYLFHQYYCLRVNRVYAEINTFLPPFSKRLFIAMIHRKVRC